MQIGSLQTSKYEDSKGYKHQTRGLRMVVYKPDIIVLKASFVNTLHVARTAEPLISAKLFTIK